MLSEYWYCRIWKKYDSAPGRLYVTYEWPKTDISFFMDIEGLFVILFAGAPRLW